MDTCINMEEFRQKLINAINTSGLSIGAAFYIYKDVFHTLEASYQDTLKKEVETSTISEEIEEVNLIPEDEEVTENENQNND